MTDPDFDALKTRLTAPLDISTVGADIDALLAHTTQLRAAIAVILDIDPDISRSASIAHLAALVGASNGLPTVPIGEADANLQLP